MRGVFARLCCVVLEMARGLRNLFDLSDGERERLFYQFTHHLAVASSFLLANIELKMGAILRCLSHMVGPEILLSSILCSSTLR